MKTKNPFKDLSRFELFLWLVSISVIITSFFIATQTDVLTLIASLIGVTALIFVAKGYVIGQVLTVVFAVFYGIISYYFKYYGEMITYLCMTAPIAAITAIEWLKHPFAGSREVEVASLSKSKVVSGCVMTAVVTFVFYFILKALGNESLIMSTISVATSFAACWLTLMRSPWYALAYAANDIVLIVLWVIASLKNAAYVPMIFCFIMFLANDVYGFFNWRRMSKNQNLHTSTDIAQSYKNHYLP